MNDQTGIPSAPLSGPVPPSYAPPTDEINLRELFDILLSGKWVILGVTLAVALLGFARAQLVSDVYRANGLIQVEKEQSGLSASVDELSSLFAGSADTTAEVAILKSRMVLGTVAEALKLQIHAEPVYFPVIGKAVARRRAVWNGPAQPPPGLGRYAWGGEVIRVTTLDVAQAWYNRDLLLEAAESGGYRLFLDEAPPVTGKVGEMLVVQRAGETLRLFVQDLRARPGTRFVVVRRAPLSVYGTLAGALTVSEQPRDSGVLNLQFESEDPVFAADALNEIQHAFLRQNVERRSEQAEQSLEFLHQQLPELKGRVNEAQAHLNRYQADKGLVDVSREAELILDRAVSLDTERLSRTREREVALQRFTEEHPVVVALDEQIRSLDADLADLRRQAESLPETQQEILSLMRDLEVNTQLYTTLLNSAQELQVAKAGTVGNVRIIDSALLPLFPVKPNRRRIVLLSVLLGLFLGTVTVFALRTLTRGVDRPEELERALGLPTYAAIPYSTAQRRLMRLLAGRDEELHLLATIRGDDPAVEALRSLRTSLHFALLEAPNNVVMFTGPGAALGKTFVSANLGALLAQAGKKVVVLDADLRRGRLHRYLGGDKAPGISDYVAGAVDQTAIVRKSTIEGLYWVACGTRPPNPAEVLMHERFADLVKTLSGDHDYVLIDTPPVLPVTDAAIVGRLAGGALLVLKSAEHPIRAIEETVRRLRNAGVLVSGVVFNQVGQRIGSYGYGAYGYAYGYSSHGYGKTPEKTA